jgi:hypothetical protein
LAITCGGILLLASIKVLISTATRFSVGAVHESREEHEMKQLAKEVWEQTKFMLPYCIRLYFAPLIGAWRGVRRELRVITIDGFSIKRCALLLAAPVTGAFRYLHDETIRYDKDLKNFRNRRPLN